MLKFHTILHATDLSPRSHHAFQLACSLAKATGARVVVLHVIVPEIGESIAQMQTQVPDYLDRIKERVVTTHQSDEGVAVEHYVTEGEVLEEIERMVQKTKADLIVIGTHGRTGLDRVLLGSVAEKVVRAGPCPVLTVKYPGS